MRSTAAWTITACALLSLASTPALAQNREHQQMAAELRMLQEQNQQLSLSLAQALAQLTDAIKAINTRLDASDAATRKALADQKVIIDGVSTELRTLRERTQDTNSRIGTLAEEIEAMRTSLSAPPPPAFAADPALDPLAPPAALPPATPSLSRSAVSPTRLFDAAYSDFTAGDYVVAVSGFQAYLAEFPRFEKADDAQLYIGESYQKQNKLKEANAAFMAVIQDYPNEDKVPDAYFRLGEVQRSTGQIDAARASWQTLVSKYPDHALATLAKLRLEGLPAATAVIP